MRLERLAVITAVALLAAGCANDGTLNTSAIDNSKPGAKTAAIDPACQALANQIATLRSEGTPERLEKAAAGKGDTVKVKRDALAKQTELNKANADFQAKCGPKITGVQAAPAPAVPPPASTPAAKEPGKEAAKTGKTSAAEPAKATTVVAAASTTAPPADGQQGAAAAAD